MVQTLTDRRLPDAYPVLAAIDYSLHERTVARRVSAGSLASSSRMAVPVNHTLDKESSPPDLAHLWTMLEFEGRRPQLDRGANRQRINIVDLFCGCGGLSLGIRRAVEAAGARPVFLFAADVDGAALKVYARNIRPLRYARQNVETLVDYDSPIDDRYGTDLQFLHLDCRMKSLAGQVDILVAGPPCEGNSNFNNRTRRFDARNDLYIDAIVAGIALDARVIIIENVPMVTRARQDVVRRSLRLLRDAGYRSKGNEFLLTASDFGTPQDRRRHFLVAAKSNRSWDPSDFHPFKIPAPTALEALEPLRNVHRATTFDQPSQLSQDNAKRVRFLIDNDEYDLPNHERPDCHRLKDHSYPSIYGRIRPAEQAPTITTGFLSPGRGRFTHPLEARSLTPHEGARLQGFGDDFDWLQARDTMTRGDYANMIGAAVPPQLGFAVGMCALSLL